MNLSKWEWGYIYWASWLLFGFLAAELAAYFHLVPWPTLSETVWHSLSTYQWLSPILFAVLIFLFMHFFYHRPIVLSLLSGLSIAVAAHLIDRSLP